MVLLLFLCALIMLILLTVKSTDIDIRPMTPINSFLLLIFPRLLTDWCLPLIPTCNDSLRSFRLDLVELLHNFSRFSGLGSMVHLGELLVIVVELPQQFLPFFTIYGQLVCKLGILAGYLLYFDFQFTDTIILFLQLLIQPIFFLP
jgi:hypothetical protein